LSGKNTVKPSSVASYGMRKTLVGTHYPLLPHPLLRPSPIFSRTSGMSTPVSLAPANAAVTSAPRCSPSSLTLPPPRPTYPFTSASSTTTSPSTHTYSLRPSPTPSSVLRPGRGPCGSETTWGGLGHGCRSLDRPGPAWASPRLIGPL